MKRLTAVLTVAVLVLWGATALVAADLPQGLQGVLAADQALTDTDLRQMRGKAAPTPLPTPSEGVGLFNAHVITGQINPDRNGPNGSTGLSNASSVLGVAPGRAFPPNNPHN